MRRVQLPSIKQVSKTSSETYPIAVMPENAEFSDIWGEAVAEITS